MMGVLAGVNSVWVHEYVFVNLPVEILVKQKLQHIDRVSPTQGSIEPARDVQLISGLSTQSAAGKV